MCFIDLPALRREKELGSIASCEARAYVISLINQHYRTVEVSCGKESTWLGGYAYTREGRQTIEDAADLVSSSSLETVQNRTGKQVIAKAYYDDLPDGKHTVVVYEVVG